MGYVIRYVYGTIKIMTNVETAILSYQISIQLDLTNPTGEIMFRFSLWLSRWLLRWL